MKMEQVLHMNTIALTLAIAFFTLAIIQCQPKSAIIRQKTELPLKRINLFLAVLYMIIVLIYLVETLR